VRETITAIRQRFPTRRLWAVFEPRSNTSRRNIHQAEYTEAFAGSSAVVIRLPEPHDKVPLDQQLDVPAIVRAIAASGVDAFADADVAPLVAHVAEGAARGDVVLVMSNGAFGGFIPQLIAALEARPA
jgi:UDP-N-acetylmuramate: L-alanyl-gamma-D-glutamyl-meso-diaminopimelate ligase